jgi:hypothetical protein
MKRRLTLVTLVPAVAGMCGLVYADLPVGIPNGDFTRGLQGWKENYIVDGYGDYACDMELELAIPAIDSYAAMVGLAEAGYAAPRGSVSFGILEMMRDIDVQDEYAIAFDASLGGSFYVAPEAVGTIRLSVRTEDLDSGAVTETTIYEYSMTGTEAPVYATIFEPWRPILHPLPVAPGRLEGDTGSILLTFVVEVSVDASARGASGIANVTLWLDNVNFAWTGQPDWGNCYPMPVPPDFSSFPGRTFTPDGHGSPIKWVVPAAP